jgi:hypothetical protein
MIITLGFTESDRNGDYVSFSDGYRIGAPQYAVSITVDDPGGALPPQLWAETAFAACNCPQPSTNPTVAAIQQALADQVRVPLRALSVGDTVTIYGQMWACDPHGWHRVDEPAGDATDQ